MAPRLLSSSSDSDECCQTRFIQDDFRTLTAGVRTKACNRYIPEIREVLRNVCKEHKIYFAQTWAPCDQQFEGGCRVPTENQCVSVVQYDAVYTFHPAVTMLHASFYSLHWAKGQGHVRKAFMTNRPCLSLIKSATHHSPYYFVTHLDNSDFYYLHYSSAVAIHIKGKDNDTPSDYILEFFYHAFEELYTLASKLCSSLQDRFKSLRVVTNKDKEVDIVNLLEIESKQRLSRARTDSSTKDQQSNGIHEHQLLPDENPSGASAGGLQDWSVHVQNETCLDATINIEHAQVCEIDTIGTQSIISSVVVGETSEERYTRVEKTINSLSDVPQDAAKITAGKSGRRARTKQDPAWKYCSELIKDKKNGPIKCSFCNSEIKGGGITRFKFHLLGRDLNKNIRKCLSVSPEAKAKMEEWLQKYIAKRNN